MNTDSFMVHVKFEDTYENLAGEVEVRFHT